MHMDWNRPRLLVGCRFDEVHMTVEGLVGQRLGGYLNFLSLTNPRQLLLIHIGLDPDLAQVGYGK